MLKIMKIYLPLLILILNIIFVESTDNAGREDNGPVDDDEWAATGKKKWPEQTFASSETDSTAYRSRRRAPSDHPYAPDFDHTFGDPHSPFYEAYYWYPKWIPNWRNLKKNYKIRSIKLKPDSRPNDDRNLPGSGEVKYLNDLVNSFGAQKEKFKKIKKNAGHSDSNIMPEAEIRQYEAELKAADMTQLLGVNQHRYQPENYRTYDLGRRFVPQYPYHEVNQNDLVREDVDTSLIPKRAPAEVVLAIAKESALLQAAEPVDPKEHLLKKESLRNGKYWNAFWKEDAEDPTNALRSHNRSKLDTITAKLSPGTPIYEYVSKLNKPFPKLLYVINKTI